jgi:hypothetical protein
VNEPHLSPERAAKLFAGIGVALRAEGVPAAVRDRIMARVIYGEPDAPHKIYPRNELFYGEAVAFCDAWFAAQKVVVSGAPDPYVDVPPCPSCGEPVTILTAGAVSPGWIHAGPCGCLFDIKPILGPGTPRCGIAMEASYGTAVSSTLFPPMNGDPHARAD